LRQVQGLGGAREAAEPGGGFEDGKLGKHSVAQVAPDACGRHVERSFTG
jgi:hypothetical protein